MLRRDRRIMVQKHDERTMAKNHGFPTPWILDFRGGRASGRLNTVPAVRKDETLRSTSQVKNLFSYCRNMFGWFGEVGGHRKNSLHRCALSFSYLTNRNVNKTINIIFRFFNTCNSSPILLFCPRNLKSDFSWKIKKDARRKMIEIRQIKS